MALPVPPNEVAPIMVNVNEFRSKYRSKQECYDFLTIECGAYLPPFKCMTVYHLKDVIAGKKKKINAAEVKYIYCPQYDNLSLPKIFNLVHENKPAILEYFPDLRGKHLLELLTLV